MSDHDLYAIGAVLAFGWCAMALARAAAAGEDIAAELKRLRELAQKGRQ